MLMRKTTFIISVAVFFVFIAFNVGVLAGQASSTTAATATATTTVQTNTEARSLFDIFTNTESVQVPEGVDLDTFWKVWNIINEKYVASEMPSDKEKTWGAVSGLVDSLGDPYSVFMPPQEAKLFEDDVSGSFDGVGMEVGLRDNILTVVSPLKNTPADRAGVLAGDAIVQINGTSTYDLSLEEAVTLIRGPRGTVVTLSIVREGADAPLEINITRDKIVIPIIETTLRKDGIFVIELYSFSETSPELFAQAIQEFKKSGSRRLILDLRNNPGGLLDAATNIAGNFLPSGKLVAREDYGTGKEETEHRTSGNFLLKDYDYTMVILINQGSASASEILAGALSEYNIASLIGEKSYGKGSVQELIKFEDGSSLKLTVARWLTPKGVSISEKGLVPHVEVPLTIDDIKAKKDPQLDAAVKKVLSI